MRGIWRFGDLEIWRFRNAPRLRSRGKRLAAAPARRWTTGYGVRSTKEISKSPNLQISKFSSRSGLTLLEVLVSVFILSIGLLGVAALIPLGKLSLVETNVCDRTGACGRAGLREVEVRRMMNPGSWSAIPPRVFAIDPLGVGAGLGPLGSLPRISLGNVPAGVFRWGDDLPFVQSSDSALNGERPVLAGTVSEGNFSWFLTVNPSPSDINLSVPVPLRRNYDVSVVVCYKRDFTAGERATNQRVQFLGGGYGGGTIQLDPDDSGVLTNVKIDQWVVLVGKDAMGYPYVAKWYRVVGVGADMNPPYLSLVGPDWDTTGYGMTLMPYLVVVDGVTGVYTTTVHLDQDCVWTR